MAIYFDTQLFVHALYVGMVYSCLAFGATYYRKYADEYEVRKYHLGEEIFSAYNPFAMLGIVTFGGLFCIFALVALMQRNPPMILYVIPIACGINIVQFLIRARHQRVKIQSRGVIVRYLFKEGGIGLGYSELRRIEARRFGTWYIVDFIDRWGLLRAQCHLRSVMVKRLLAMARLNPECEVLVEE